MPMHPSDSCRLSVHHDAQVLRSIPACGALRHKKRLGRVGRHIGATHQHCCTRKVCVATAEDEHLASRGSLWPAILRSNSANCTVGTPSASIAVEEAVALRNLCLKRVAGVSFAAVLATWSRGWVSSFCSRRRERGSRWRGVFDFAALALAIVGVVSSSAGCDGCNGGTVDSYDGSALVCELSIHCPSGSFCDLGRCVQSCSDDQDCDDGSLCDLRGRCDVDRVREKETKPAYGLALEADDVITVRSDSSSTTLRLSGPDHPTRFRVEAPQGLEVSPSEGEFRGSIDLEVFRSLEEEEEEEGLAADSLLVVVSEVGTKVVALEVRELRAGIYQGVLRYDTPFPIGSLPLRLVIWRDGERLLGEIDSDYTPGLWREDEVRSLAFEFAIDETELATGTVYQVYDTGVSGRLPQLDRRIVRKIELTFDLSEDALHSGEFSDTWYGVSKRAISLSGKVLLNPIPNDSGGSGIRRNHRQRSCKWSPSFRIWVRTPCGIRCTWVRTRLDMRGLFQPVMVIRRDNAPSRWVLVTLTSTTTEIPLTRKQVGKLSASAGRSNSSASERQAVLSSRIRL